MSLFAEEPAGGRTLQAPSLIETLIIVAILAILAASAMPFVRDAVVREKVSECLDRAAAAQVLVADYRRVHGDWPKRLPLREHAATLMDAYCNGISGYDRVSGAFMVNVNEETISSHIQMLQPQLTPELDAAGRVDRWRCTRGDTPPEDVRLLPEACQAL